MTKRYMKLHANRTLRLNQRFPRETLIQYHHLKGESARKGALFCLKEGVCYGL